MSTRTFFPVLETMPCSSIQTPVDAASPRPVLSRRAQSLGTPASYKSYELTPAAAKRVAASRGHAAPDTVPERHGRDLLNRGHANATGAFALTFALEEREERSTRVLRRRHEP